MARRRTLVLLGAAAALAATAGILRHRHADGDDQHTVPGGILVGHVPAYDAMTRRLLGPFYRGVAADVAATAPDGARVLEVGCGPGNLSIRLAQDHGMDVTAVDLDPQMIARARDNAAADGSGLVPSFGVADAASLDFPDATFDVVVTTLSMHHWDDPGAGLAEIARVLRHGGRALVWDLRPHRRLPCAGRHHAQIPDPAALAVDAGLDVVVAEPWRWPWRFSLVQKTELARAPLESTGGAPTS